MSLKNTFLALLLNIAKLEYDVNLTKVDEKFVLFFVLSDGRSVCPSCSIIREACLCFSSLWLMLSRLIVESHIRWVICSHFNYLSSTSPEENA